jgi:hypothetical protein
MSPIEDETPAEATKSVAGRGSEAAPAREETRGPSEVVPVNILVAPEDRRRLRQLSLDTNLSLQKLGHEAWNLLLQKRGLPPLKPVSANVPSGRASGRSRDGV